MSDFVLVIANKAYSSWSMRPWLAMVHFGIPFSEIVIPLRQADTARRIAQHSPTGKVPVLQHGTRVIWESIAILEYLAEQRPNEHLWPRDPAARALARAVSAEMHAGFQALRTQLPMNVRVHKPDHPLTPEVEKDILRITTLWRQCRERWGDGGSFLFGRFSNADAMYAPVVGRFTTYGVALDADAQAYCDAVLALPAVRRWYDEAKDEPWHIADYH